MGQNLPILVAGGAGFIGSHTCKALFQAGYCPIVLDNLCTGYRDYVKWGPFIEGSISNEGLVGEIVQHYQPCAVIHFASSINVGESVQDPQKYILNNVCDTVFFLKALRENGLEKIVFSSSAAVYGPSQVKTIDEGHPIGPINPYGYSKAWMETMLASYRDAYGMQSVIFRYFNAAGADKEGELGESHDPETHLIPLILQSALEIGDPITLFGQNYDTPDGTCIRDYVHVMDLADAHVKAIDYLLDGGPSVILNLGSEVGYSVAEVIKTASEVLGCPIPHKWGARREGDPARLVANPQKAKTVLHWQARHSDLSSLILDAWKWQRRLTSDSRPL